MLEKRKKGQIQISFGMIFSIIIIIATVAIGAYVIMHFMSLSKCTKISLFYKSLQDETTKAWEGDMTQRVVNINLPSGIDEVCIGNLTLGSTKEYETEYEELKRFRLMDRNLFLYPLGTSCGGNPAIYKLDYVQSVQLFCSELKSGIVSIKLSKDVSDSYVKLSKP